MKAFARLLPLFFVCLWAEAVPQNPDSDSLVDVFPQKVDLKPFCPQVRHQGELASCVGWAIGYGTLTIERAIQEGCTDVKVITHNASSALFIFNQIKREGGVRGSRLSDAAAFLEENGDCLSRHFDTAVNDADKQPSEALTEAACSFSIAGARALFEAGASAALKVEEVKEALRAKKPVAVGLAIRRNFVALENALYWWPDLGDTTPAGGHALVVVGFDERKKAFQLMNSWGEGWGKGGFIWLKYEVFGQFCKSAYVLNLR